MAYWITMHDKSNKGYSGVYVINSSRYIQSATPIKRGDKVAIYVGKKRGGPQAVVALVEVTKRENRIASTDKKKGRKRTWLQVAKTKPIDESGYCTLDELLSILKPKKWFRNEQAKGGYLSGRCACKISPITPEEFDEIGNYFPDYESHLKRLQKVSTRAVENEEEVLSEQGFASGEEER